MTNPFTQQPIVRQKTIGERLIAAREQAGMSVADAARATKISAAYITALETGRYHDLPSPVYIRNYLKVYGGIIGISWDVLEPLYKKEIALYRNAPVAQHEQKEQLLKKKRLRTNAQKIQVQGTEAHKPAVLIPQLLKYGGLSLIVLVVGLYILMQIVSIYNPPPLEVRSPQSDLRVSENPVKVQGVTAPESIVEINGQQTNVHPDGTFTVDVFLQDGLNTLQISTRSKRSKKREVIRYVLYVPVERGGVGQ